MIASTCRHIDVLRFDAKAASTALARAPFGSLEERRANALAARLGRDAEHPREAHGRAIAKHVDLRIVGIDDRASHRRERS